MPRFDKCRMQIVLMLTASFLVAALPLLTSRPSFARELVSCGLGNRSVDAAAFSYLSQMHLRTCDDDTPALLFAPASNTGGVGYALNQLLLAFHYAVLQRKQLIVFHQDAWLWTRSVSLLQRNATMSDVYWPGTCETLAGRRPHLLAQARKSKINWYMRQCQNYKVCDWANRVPKPFAGQCVVWWYSRLAHFYLRPSRELVATLRRFALSEDRCPRRLCGAHVSAVEPAGSLLSVRLQNEDRLHGQEQAILQPLLVSADPSTPPATYRPPFVGELARQLLLLPNRSFDTSVHSLHVRGGDSCADFIRPRCRTVEEGWETFGKVMQRRSSVTTTKRPLVLVSTDTTTDSRWRPPNQWSWPGVRKPHSLAFAFSRTSYQSRELIETRLNRGRGLDPTNMLLESLLDLILAAQATSLHVGSFYSNFARLAMLLSGSFTYASFDGSWCPYELCNAGRRDARYFCSGRRPNVIMDIELRGSPLDKRAPVHAARTAWVAAMQKLSQRIKSANDSFQACLSIFEEVESLPLIY